jgi:hypothetical protein
VAIAEFSPLIEIKMVNTYIDCLQNGGRGLTGRNSTGSFLRFGMSAVGHNRTFG